MWFITIITIIGTPICDTEYRAAKKGLEGGQLPMEKKSIKNIIVVMTDD